MTGPAREAPRAHAVMYLRVSTKEQAERGGETEGFSIPAQREACRRKARSLNADVIEEFVDRGESAKTAARPELQRLLAFVRDVGADYVIVHKVDRLARNRLDDALINVELQKAGAMLVSCTENIDETPSGVLLHGIMSSISEFYSRNLANEVIKGSVQKAKNGGTIGRAPTGYVNVRRIENGIEVRSVEVDPERGPLMAWAFEAYASGNWSLRRLTEELERRGLTSVPSKERPSKPLVMSNVHRLLRHPYYKGVVRYRGVEYTGRHAPLVSVEMWDQVQHILDVQNHAGERQRQHRHYLKGSLFCGHCGARLSLSKNRGRRGKLYEYFVCLGRARKRTGCTQSAMPTDVVEALVEAHYATIQPSASLVNGIRAALTEELRSNANHAEAERTGQRQRVRKLEAQRQKLLEGYYAAAITVDMLRTEQQRISRELTIAQSQLDALEVRFDIIERNLDAALSLAADWHGAYLRANPAERRLLNQAIFERLYISAHGPSVRHQFAEPFDLLLSAPVVQAGLRHGAPAGPSADLIDQTWSQLAAQWSAEVLTETGPPHERTPDLALVGGSDTTLMVGAEVWSLTTSRTDVARHPGQMSRVIGNSSPGVQGPCGDHCCRCRRSFTQRGGPHLRGCPILGVRARCPLPG